MLGWVETQKLSELLPAKEARAIKQALGASSVTQLLEHYPRAYSHHGSGVDVGSAEEGDVVTCVGTVTWAKTGYTSTGKLMHRIVISDGYHDLAATFFQAKLPGRQLKVGVRAMFSGKIKYFRDMPQISHPSYVVLPNEDEMTQKRTIAQGNLRSLQAFGSVEELEQLLASLEFLPIYPVKKGMTSWRMLGCAHTVLDQLDPIPEPLDQPPADLPSFDAAIRGVHFPDEAGPDPYIERIKYNEALSLALVMALRKVDVAQRNAPVCAPVAGAQSLVQRLVAQLPYSLTAGQQQVVDEIASDIARPHPMNRLLQGEVGSGKTVVALLSMLRAIDAGYQCALLAPTEVLAAQHARGLSGLLEQLPVQVTLLTGSMSTAAKKQALLDIVSGESNIVVGTHALLQESVEFFNLGLAVVDEQHRFGVEQRDRLRTAGAGELTPHLLVMTATPIPRTIAMTTFGDLEISTLKELPGGRAPITSVVVPGTKPAWVARAWERIREEVAAGHQAYVVCPRIDGPGGVVELHQQLEQQFADLTVGLLHGRLSGEEKDAVMASFAAGDIDVLVSTTVIEVGIDVHNATVMYIREAEHFGVSQLHQLRGRVGRGGLPGLCLLHSDQPEESASMARLQAVAATTDGFELAEIDLVSRQEGDVLGTAQSGGHKRVKLLNLTQDVAVIARAAEDAKTLVERNRALAEQLVSDVEVQSQEFIEKS